MLVLIEKKMSKPKVNAACPCGSGVKFKKCCKNKPPKPEGWFDRLSQLLVTEDHPAHASFAAGAPVAVQFHPAVIPNNPFTSNQQDPELNKMVALHKYIAATVAARFAKNPFGYENKMMANMYMNRQQYLQWRLDQAGTGVSQIHRGVKRHMIAEGCDDYEYVNIYRADVGYRKLPVQMIWGENGDMGTVVVDIPDGCYRVEETVDGEGKPVFLNVKDKKIDEAELHKCSAYADWSLTSSLHMFYEFVIFNVHAKTVLIGMGS
jgi:hypothetical protein